MKAFTLVALVAALAAPAAAADGLPVFGFDVGTNGVTVPGSQVRYVALGGPRDTLLARTSMADGRVLAYTYLHGHLTVPAVAYDGTAGGLSYDRRTLVLLRPRAGFPIRRTHLRVLHAPTMRTLDTIDLRGDYSFDAISPDGAWIYLIHYLSPRDPTLYEVRVYDVHRGRLLPEPIVDPRESDEEMRGKPLTRATSSEGRWAYTLYDGNGKPFVHALDTVGHTARCIDLDGLAGHKLNGARLVLEDGSLSVRLRGRTLAVVGKDVAAAGFPWAPLCAAVFIALVGAGIAVRRRLAP